MGFSLKAAFFGFKKRQKNVQNSFENKIRRHWIFPDFNLSKKRRNYFVVAVVVVAAAVVNVAVVIVAVVVVAAAVVFVVVADFDV